MSARMWFPDDTKCGIGQPGYVCGEQVVMVIAVHAFEDAWARTAPTPGVVFLCRRHSRNAVHDWDTPAEMNEDDHQ